MIWRWKLLYLRAQRKDRFRYLIQRTLIPYLYSNVKIKTPEYYQGSANLSVKKTYLDTLGRPTIVLKTRNISPDSQDEVQVSLRILRPVLAMLRYCLGPVRRLLHFIPIQVHGSLDRIFLTIRAHHVDETPSILSCV